METASYYKPVTIKKLSLPGNLFLAPVAGYSDKAYRSICIDWGADFTYTEMVSSEAFVRNSVKTDTLIERADNEKVYAVQLFGASPAYMAETAAAIVNRFQPACIDINAGCPMPKITKTGAGSALMRQPEKLYRIIKAVADAVEKENPDVPVTVKIRSGWSQRELSWKACARAAADAGAAAITLHPRTCEQCYSGKADWDILAELVSFASGWGIPIFGSGDLFSPEDAHAMFSHTNCAGLMFARGAMGNPFIFTQTKEFLSSGCYRSMTLSDKLASGKKELILLCREKNEAAACKEMRKRFAAYIKGVDGGSRIREQLVKASSILEYEQIVQQTLNEACPKPESLEQCT